MTVNLLHWVKLYRVSVSTVKTKRGHKVCNKILKQLFVCCFDTWSSVISYMSNRAREIQFKLLTLSL